MASNIKGITVEIGGDTTGLSKALKEMNTDINSTQKELKEVEKLLKLDPSNTELLAQKQKLLATQIENTKNKVSVLKDAQKQADNEIKNGTEVSEAQYRKLQREIANAEIQTKSLEEQSEKTHGVIAKIKDAFSGIGDVAVQGLKLAGETAVALTTAGVAGTLALGKSAVEAYAEYEQLAGGVETLFGSEYSTVEEYAEATGQSLDSATNNFEKYQERQQRVLENANNAYKTAGMSANEYMETVTGFAASLNASLGEYSWQSAEYADMAISDMSDNANKMGTNIESIKNAYAGFAKGNFTMLDNLKLGYGGTKEEMDKLMRKAEELEGYEVGSLDKDNFADVIEAIHIIQEDLGIYGTTAKEASKTISGSVSAMKSAWTNLVAGMANENANLEGLINNVVDSAVTVLDNIIPRIEVFVEQIPSIMTNLISKITEKLPQLLETGAKILQSLINGIAQNMPQIINAVSQIVASFTNTIITMLPEILQMGIVILTELIHGIAVQLPELVPAIVECILLIVDTIINNLDTIIEVGLEVIMALIQGIIDSLPKIIEKLPVIVQKIVDVITNNIPLIIEAGFTILVALIKGIIENIPELIKAIPQIIEALIQGFNNLMSKIVGIGKNIIEGLWNGIKNAKDWLINKIKSLCNDALDAIKAFFGIESPSKVMRDEVGKFLAEGIGVGFTRTIPGVIDDMKNKLGSVASELSGDLLLGDIPQLSGGEVINQNRYVTKNYTNTMNTFRDAQPLVLNIDGKTFARAIIPSMDAEYVRMGVAQA